MDKLPCGYVLTPAYGRDYSSREEVILDLNAGKDFRANGPGGSGYCSIRDLADGDWGVRIRQRAEKVIVSVKDGVAS